MENKVNKDIYYERLSSGVGKWTKKIISDENYTWCTTYKNEIWAFKNKFVLFDHVKKNKKKKTKNKKITNFFFHNESIYSGNSN